MMLCGTLLCFVPGASYFICWQPKPIDQASLPTPATVHLNSSIFSLTSPKHIPHSAVLPPHEKWQAHDQDDARE